MKNETRQSHKGAALLAALLAAGLWAPQAAGQRKGQPNMAAQNTIRHDAGQIFSRGKFMFDNNDTSDEAARLFRQVIDGYPGSHEAEAAQFFLGSYYQRKYQIRARRTGEQELDTLARARRAYEDYVQKYPQGGPCECLADAYFNLALVNMQMGESGVARYNLSRMKEAAGRDPYVYIYQVSWTGSQKDIIDGHFSTARLADYVYDITGLPFEQAASLLRVWCMSEKSKAKASAPAPRRRSAFRREA